MLTLEQVQAKSASKLSGLHPVVRKATEALIEICYNRGVPIVITQGLRTNAEQDALYAQGRSADGRIVTNARGGYSFHNFGLAVDFALLLPDGRTVSWDQCRDGDGDGVTDWDEVVAIAKTLGFEWGGDWTGIKDYPHFQVVFGLTTAQLRAGRTPTETDQARAMAAIERLTEEERDVKVDKAKVIVNGEKLAEESVLIEGRTYVPLAAIGKAIGATVGWDNKTKTATLTTKEGK
ncbi:M15 family metallopeptidase [Paenibacillus zanthoxyli]|uniref:M15 family metallopeptidase n=1 Tax=Paenibacillus zanthoxyli TaxID=369399 RepID=UPI0004706CAD|nr:M15 family metallopeptidase [Paenibacillus zanthoxyli]